MAFSLRNGAWLAIAMLAAMPEAAAEGASVSVSASVSAVKPLTLTAKQDLNFGQIIITRITAPTTVSISQVGVLSCGTGLTCSGVVKAAIFNVTGSNNQVVRITSAPSNLVSPSGSAIPFVPSAPASVTLTSSGVPGNDFNVGGSITVSPTTADGLYTGNVEITVDYQ